MRVREPNRTEKLEKVGEWVLLDTEPESIAHVCKAVLRHRPLPTGGRPDFPSEGRNRRAWQRSGSGSRQILGLARIDERRVIHGGRKRGERLVRRARRARIEVRAHVLP